MANPYFNPLIVGVFPAGPKLATEGEDIGKTNVEMGQKLQVKKSDLAKPVENAPAKPTGPEPIKTTVNMEPEKTPEQIKAEDPRGGQTYTPEEIKKSEENQRRLEIGVAAYKKPSEVLTDGEKKISAILSGIVSERAAETERQMKAVGVPTETDSILTEKEKESMARIHWQAQIQDPSYWKSLNRANKAIMMEYFANNNEAWNAMRDQYGPQQSWWDALEHGAAAYAKSIEVKGVGVGAVKGIMKTYEAQAELTKVNDLRRRTAHNNFFKVLKQFKSDPAIRDTKKVESIYQRFLDNPDLMDKDGLIKDPEVHAAVKSLNEVEAIDLFVRLNHKKPSTKFGKDAPPVTLDDFDLDNIPENYKYSESMDVAASYRLASGGMGGGAAGLTGIEKENYSKVEARRKITKNGKIHPIDFIENNIGKGLFAGLEKETGRIADLQAAVAYGYASRKLEGGIAGAGMLYEQIFGAGEDPHTWVSRLKRHLKFGANSGDIDSLIAWYDAAQTSTKELDNWMKGGKSQIGARLASAFSNVTLEEAQEYMLKHGYLNDEFINVGMMKVMPAALVGRAAVISRAGTTAGMGVIGVASHTTRSAARLGIISLDRYRRMQGGLMKAGEFAANAEAKLFGAPVKLIGAITLGTGKTVLYAGGGLVQGLAKATNKMLSKVAPEMAETLATQGAKKVLGAIGVTSAFHSFGVLEQVAGLYGMGAAAEAAGGLLYKYGYRGTNLSGRTFAGALADAAKDESLSAASRTLAKIGNVAGGLPAAALYDFTKGGWHGGGVGIGLGFVQDGKRGAINGFWGGVGMGGAGALHATVQMYRAGIYTHSIAENELRKMMKDAPERAGYDELIKRATDMKDWTLLPMAVGAIKLAGANNIKVYAFSERNLPDLGIEILREDTLAPSDYTVSMVDAAGNVVPKQFLIPSMKVAAEQARALAARLSANAKTEADFAKAEQASKLAEKAEIDLHNEFNEWLSAVRQNGTADQKARVRSGTTLFNGVHIDGGVGNGIIYVNVGLMRNSTIAHELFHGVQMAVYRSQAVNHFANQVFGIRILNGQLIAQDGAVTNLEMLKQFQELYLEVLHRTPTGADPVTKALFEKNRSDAVSELQAAFDVLNKDQSGLSPDAINGAHETLRKAAEEFGANYFEAFLQRNRPDYLFKGGKYSAIKRILNTAENFLDFQIRNDIQGEGISLNAQRALDNRRSAEFAEKLTKINVLKERVAALNDRLNDPKLLKVTKRDPVTGEIIDYHFTDKAAADAIERLIERRMEDIRKLEASLGKQDVGDVFRDASGAHLVIPAVDKMIKQMIERMDKQGTGTNALDLSTLPPAELQSVLKRAGLTHFLDANGRLKSQQQINKEAVARGEKALAVLQTLGPVSGMVVHTDESGTRASGVLTKEGIDALVKADAILPNEAKNAMALIEGIKTAMGIGTLSGSTFDLLYHGLSHENEAADGTVNTSRKPRDIVEPTFRRIVPYRMDFVMTTKGRDGAKVDPHFELMVTALDLDVLLANGTENFNASYTLPSGRVIRAADLFGGSFEVFKHHLQRYLHSMSQSNAPAGADIFGGGETGAAIRDIMYKTVGAIKGTSGKDNAGNPLLINNPIISPFKPSTRGPKFVFTTFRVDLMSDLSARTDRWSFNERYAYPRVQNNYSAAAFGEPVTLKGGLQEVRATHEFDISKDAETGESETVRSNYRVYQKGADRRFYITSDVSEFGSTKEYNFGTMEEAKRFVSILAQRHMLASQNKLSSTLMGGDSGIVVSNINGNYVLMDTNNNYRIVQGGRIYSDQNRAVMAATLEHNTGAMLKLSKGKNKKDFQLAQALMSDSGLTNPIHVELMMPRLQLKADGTPKLEKVKNGKKEVTYKESDPEVKAGLAKVGEVKRKLAFQKVNYNLMLSMFGNQTLRMGDPVVQRGAEQVAVHIDKEAIEAIKDPEVRKALGWYRSMVKSGYSVLGSMYGIFTESLGATSARTDVEQNFIQAEEAVALFSQGKYDKVLEKIHAQIDAIQRRIDTKDSNDVSQFEAEAVRLMMAKKALDKVVDQFDFDSGDYDIHDFLSRNTESGLTQEHFDAFDRAAQEATGRRKKSRLSREELSEAARLSLSAIFRNSENLMLRANGKKFNANTVKVGQVLYGMWRRLTDGPKTPNFAGNLEGTTREATIDVWAARTLHRVINSRILHRARWRLSAGMEKGVDYAWHDNGSTENPNIEVGGDFGFGQLAFKKAADSLKAKGIAEFKDLSADDLQALMWFAEKRLWAERGWTEGAGAEMSSFEQPMERMSGTMDPNGIEGWGNLRRMIAGFTGNYGPESLRIQVGGVPIDASGTARNTAQPRKVLDMVKGVARAAFGGTLRALNVNQTNGLYGGYIEHSVSFDALVHRGRMTEFKALADRSASKLDSARVKMEQAAEADRLADPASKKETGKRLRAATTAYKNAKAKADNFGSMYTAEQSNPTVRNQLGLVTEGFIDLARNYLQKDVMVGETVGPNHPNARPALDIMFEKPMTLAEVSALVKAMTGTSDGIVTGFTAIPDPRSPNAARITQITKILNKMGGPEGKPSVKDQYLYRKLEAELNTLRRFKGIQAQANPEMTFRYRSYNDNVRISKNQYDLMSEAGARSFMADWKAVFTKAKPLFESYNGNRLTFNEYHISTETIASGGFDTFNPADIGAERSLGDRLRRYERDLNRELASFEEQSTGRVGSADSPAYTPDRTAWRSADGTEAPISGRENVLSDDAAGQVGSGEAGNQRVETLSPQEAKKWVDRVFSKPITGTNNEAGIAWGDKDYTIYQKRNADGSLSQEFRVMGKFDRKPTVVTGREAAVSEVTARLTGQKGGQAGERLIKVNGVEFTVTEGMRPVVSPDGKVRMEYGAFGKKDDIWSFSPTTNDVPQVIKHGFGSVSDVGAVKRLLLTPTGRPTGYLLSDKAEQFVGRVNQVLGMHTVPDASGNIPYVHIVEDGQYYLNEEVGPPSRDPTNVSGNVGISLAKQTFMPSLARYRSKSEFQIATDPNSQVQISSHRFGSQDIGVSRFVPTVKQPAGSNFTHVPLDPRTYFGVYNEATTSHILESISMGQSYHIAPKRDNTGLPIGEVPLDSSVSAAQGLGVTEQALTPYNRSDFKLRLSDDGTRVLGSTADKAKIGSATVMSGGNFYFSKGYHDAVRTTIDNALSKYGFLDGSAATKITGVSRSDIGLIKIAAERLRESILNGIKADSEGIVDPSKSMDAYDQAFADFGQAASRVADINFLREFYNPIRDLTVKFVTAQSALWNYAGLRVKANMADVYAVSEAFRGAGSALNGENAARLSAIGVGTPDTQGASSYIVNKTGAVYKTRRNTYGEGNTVFAYEGESAAGRSVSRRHTSTDAAVAETVALDQTGHIVSFIQRGKAYSPAGKHLGLDRAFNSDLDAFGYSIASKKNGGLFSKRAQAQLPDEIEIHTSMDSAGNIRVKAIDSNDHNWQRVDEKDPSTGFSQRQQEDGVIMEFALMVGRKHGKEGSTTDGRSVPPTGDVTITGMWRPKKDPKRSSWNDDVSQDVTNAEGDVIGDIDTVESYYDKRKRRMMGSQPRSADPKIESAVIAEVVERLRQSGIKMIGEDPFDATHMFDQIKDAMKGKDPSKWTKGWEHDEPYWKIDPKKEYSPASGDEPAFVGVDRVFSETGVSPDTLYSKTARAKLRDFTIDFNRIQDEELRAGMDDAPLGANKGEALKNPLAIVSLNRKGGKGEAVAEFYLMPVIHTDRGMTYGHAVLQMSRKKANITTDNLVGVLSEITERLRMTGVRQIFVPRKAWAELAVSKRAVIEKLQKQAEEMGAEIDVPDLTTITDEHDGLSIVLGSPDPNQSSGGPINIYHIKRKQQYSPASGEGYNSDIWTEPEVSRAVFVRGKSVIDSQGYSSKHRLSLLPERLQAMAVEYQGLADILDKDETYDFIPQVTGKGSAKDGAQIGARTFLEQRLDEIVSEFARHHGYREPLEHNSRSPKLEGKMKSAYGVLGIDAYAGLESDPARLTQTNEFGNHTHRMVGRGTYFDHTNLRHRDALELAMDEIIATGDWKNPTFPDTMNMGQIIGDKATLTGKRIIDAIVKDKGYYGSLEVIGRRFKLQEAMERAGFTGYREHEMRQGTFEDEAGPHVAVYGSQNVKLRNRINYDKDGKIIPVHLRFDRTNLDVRFSPVDIERYVPNDRSASPVTDPKENPEGFLYHVTLASLDQIKKGGLKSRMFYNSYDPETGRYLDADAIEDPSRQVIWFAASEGESNDVIRGGHTYQLRIKESKLTEYADLTDAEREGSGSGFIAEGGSKPWSVRPEFLEYRIIDSKKYEGTGDWLPVAGPPSKKKGKGNGK